jgi:predicted transcriptional regulator
MKTITIRVNDEIESELKKAAEAAGFSQSEVVREALEKHLKIQRFKTVRNLVMSHAENQG